MPNRAVVLTISDRCSRGQAEDRSGPTIIDLLPDLDATLVHRELVPDDIERIRAAVHTWIGRCELVIATGGTGITRGDVTPEALKPLIDKHLPGFGEAMRLSAFERVPLSIITRAGAGLAKDTLLVWLPGSPKAVKECLEALGPAIRHVGEFLRGQQPH